MPLALQLWQLLIFSVVVLCPLPFSLSLVVMAESGMRKPSLARCLLVIFSSWCTTQVSIGLGLGILERLALVPVLIAEAIILAIGLVLYAYVRRRFSWSFRSLLTLSPRLTSLEVLVIGVLCTAGLGLLWTLASQPVIEYDSLAYHLPIMATWYQSHSLAVADAWELKAGYPYNWEVLGTLFLMPFHEDFLVALPNLIAWIILGLAVYVAAVEIGATRTHSLASAVLVLIMPISLEHVNTMHVDLALGTFYVAAACFGLVYHRTHSPLYLALFLATLGLTIGIKTSGPAYGLLLVVGLALLEFQLATRRKVPLRLFGGSARLVLPVAILGVAGLLLMGGFWYMRNWIHVGNPFGDTIQIRMANITIFPGKSPSSDLRSTTFIGAFDPTSRAQWNLLLDGAKVTLSIPFFWATLQVLLLPILLLTGNRFFSRRLLLGLIVFLLGTLALYWITPFSWAWSYAQATVPPQFQPWWLGEQARYGYAFLAVVGIGAAVGLSAIRARAEISAGVVLISAVLVMHQSWMPYVAIALFFVWGLFGVIDTLRRVRHVPKLSSRLLWSAVLLLCVVVIVGGSMQARQMRAAGRRATYGPIVDFVAANVRDDETIGVVASHRGYFLFGADLNRRVEYLPAANGSLPEWIESLRSQGISLLAVGGPMLPEWKSRPDVLWLQDPSGPFARIFDGQPDGGVPAIYRLNTDWRSTPP